MIKNPLTAVARHFAEQRFWRWATPLLAPGLAVANPTGADIVSGNVAITNTDPNTLTVNQSTASAAINWQQFSVGASEYVVFNQPSVSAITLNRVVGGTPSEIFGHLLSNGRIFLINPNGILFGQGSQIDVGALVASTANMTDADFASGRYVLGNAGTGSIFNNGNIIAGPHGFVVLAADSVTNNGLIQANLGEVVLAAGNAFTLDLTGEGLINFQVDQAALSNQSGVTNLGQLVADGGKVLMTARTAAGLARTVVNNDGLVQAHSISQTESGEIVLTAVGGDIDNAGTLDASAINGAAGGTIQLVGDHATKLEKTSIVDAHGDAGANGGSVHVSGHSVLIRGLLNIGHGGNLLLDPTDMEIKDGYGSVGSNQIYEQWIEDQLRAGANITVTATHSITLDSVTGGVIDGRGSQVERHTSFGPAAGAGNGGELTLGIGTGSLHGGLTTGSGGGPGGGIHFANLGNAIIVDRGLKVIGGSQFGDIAVGDLTATNGSIEIEAHGGITVGNVSAHNALLMANESGDIVTGNLDLMGNGYSDAAGLHGALLSIKDNNGNIHVGGHLNVNGALGNVFASTSSIVIAGADVSLDALAGNVTVDGNVSIHGAVGNVGASSALNHDTIDGARFKVTAGGTGVATFKGSVSVTGSLGSVTVSGTNDVVAGVAVGDITASNSVTLSEFGHGGITAGNIVAGSSAHLNNYGVGDINVGTVTAGSSVGLYDGGPGNINAGDITGHGQVSVYAAHGDLNLHDVTVLQNGANPYVRLYAEAYGSGASQGHVNINKATVSTGPAGLEAYASVHASNDVTINDLVMHGGGGTFPNQYQSQMAFAWIQANNGDITIHAADITTDPVHGASDFVGPNNSYHNVNDHADASISMSAGRGITLGDIGAGAFAMDAHGDARLNLSASSDITLNNVSVMAEPVLRSHFTQSHGSSYSSPAWHYHHHSHSSANNAVTAQIDANTYRNIIVPTGGAVTVTATGNANLYLHAGSSSSTGGVTLDGNVAVTANPAFYTNFSHNNAHSSTWARAPLGFSRNSTNYSSNFGGASLGVTAHYAPIHVGGTVNVLGAGLAQAHLQASGTSSAGIEVAVGGALSVVSQGGHNSFNSLTTYNGAVTNATRNVSSYGDAYAGLSAPGGLVSINGIVSVTGSDAPVNSSGGSFHYARLWLQGGSVDISGGVGVTGNQAAIYQQKHQSSRDSYGSFHAGAALLNVHASNGSVTIENGAVVDVQGNGFAKAFITANGGGVNIDGTLIVNAGAAQFSQSGSNRYGSGASHNRHHDSGLSFGSAYAGIGAYGGDLVINGTVNVDAPADATLSLYAGLTSFVPHHVVVGSHGKVQVNATGGGSASSRWHHHVQDSYGYAGNLFRHSDSSGNAAYADLYVNADGFTLAYGGNVAVTGVGNAEAVINTKNHGDVAIDGTLSVTGNRAYFNSHHDFIGSGSNNSHGHDYGSMGNAEVRINVDRSGSGSGGNFIEGTTGVITVQDHGGAPGGSHPSALLDIEARGFAHVHGNVTVDGSHGWRQHYGHGFQFSYSKSYASADYADGGQARLDLHAGNSVSIGSSAVVNVHAYGNAGASITAANNNNVFVDGKITITADQQLFHGSHSPGSFWDHWDGFQSLRTSNGAYGSAGLRVYGHSVSFGSQANVMVKGAGYAALNVNVPGNITVNGVLTVSADSGMRDSHYTRGNLVATETSGTQFVLDQSRFSHMADYGSAYLSLHAGSGSGAQGQVAINAPVTVMGAGYAGANIWAHAPSGAAAVTINNALTVKDRGGYYSHGSTRHDLYRSSPSDSTRTNNYAYAGFGNANVFIGAYGPSNDIVVTAAGSTGPGGKVLVQAPGNAQLTVYANRDLQLDGPVSVIADAGSYSSFHPGTWTHPRSSDVVDVTWNSSAFARAGFANLEIQQARDLTVAAPLTITGNGGAFLSPEINFRNVTIDAPLQIVDQGNYYQRHYSSSSNRIGSHNPWHYTYRFDSSGANGSYAHSGGAGAGFTVYQNFLVDTGGSITVRGVRNANLNINAYNGASGYGHVDIHGPITVQADANSYRFGSSNNSSRAGYTSHYRFASNSSLAHAAVHLSAANDLHLYSGAPLNVTAAGNIDFTLYAGNNLLLDGPVTVRSLGGNYQYTSSYQSHNITPSRTADYSYNSSYNSHFGNVNATLDARRDVTIGATGGITMDAVGRISLGITAGSGSYGDLTINGPISLHTTGSHSASHYRQHSNSANTNGYSSHYDSQSRHTFTGGDINLDLRANGYTSGSGSGAIIRGGHLAINAGISADAVGSVTVSGNAPNGIDITAPITLNAHAGHSASSYDSSGDWVNAGGLDGRHTTSHSFSSSNYAGARLDFTANRGPLHVGGTGITVSGDGYAGVSLTGNYSDGAHPSYGVTIDAPITVTGRPSHSTWNSTAFNSNFNVGSGNVRTQTRFFTSHQGGSSNQGTGNLSIGAPLGNVDVNGSLSVTGAGYANVSLAAYKNVTINAPVTVTATTAFSSSVRSQASQYTSSGSINAPHAPITYFNSFAYGQLSRSGGASFNVYAFTGNIDQKAAVTVSGVDFAQAYFHGNYYSASGSHAVNLRAPITVTASGGSETRFANSSHQATLTSGSTATVLSHNFRHEAWSGRPGRAYLYLREQRGDITGDSNATIDVNANGSAYAGAQVFGGNLSLQAPVSVTANAASRGHHLDGVSYSNGRYNHSYGNSSHGSYGQALFNASDYRYNGLGGSLALGSVNVTGAGQAQALVHLNGSTTVSGITLNGPVTVDGGMGHFVSSSHNKNINFSNGNQNSYLNHHAGSIGYGSLNVTAYNGGAITASGPISVTGAGRAAAQFTTWSGGGIDLGSDVTITANPGHFHYDHVSHQDSGTFHNSNSFNVTGSGGYGDFEARAYNGGNVSLADVTVQGFGSSGSHTPGGANAYIWSQNGTVSANHLTVNAGLGSHSQHGFSHTQYPGYSNSDHYGSNNAFGFAFATMYGYAGLNLGSLDVHAAGSAGASLTALTGNVTVAGPIAITATQGIQSGHNSGSFVSGSNRSGQHHYIYNSTSASAHLALRAQTGNVSAAAITVSAEGWANASVHASNGSVTVTGPIGIYSTKRAIQIGSSANSGHSGTYHHHNSAAWNSAAGSANLNIYAGQNVNVGAIDMAASGSVGANIHAVNGSANVAGPVTLNAKAGNYDYARRYGTSRTGRPSTSTSSGYPGYQQSSHSHRVATSGSASLEVYGGAGVTVGPVDVKGAGYVNANFGANNSGANAQLGPVSLTITSKRIATSTGGNSYDNHQGRSYNNTYNDASSYGSAFLNARAAGALNAGSITVNGLGYAGATLQGNGGVTVTGPIMVATLAGHQDNSNHNFNHFSTGFSYHSDHHNTQDAGSAYLSVSGPNVAVTGGVMVAGAGNAYGSLHASTGALNVLGPVSVLSQAGHYTHDNDYHYHYNSGTTVHNHNSGTFDGGSATLYAKAPSISLGAVTVSAAPGFANAYISASNGAVTTGPVSVTGSAAHTVSNNQHAALNGAGTSSNASSGHVDNSIGSASLHLSGLRGVTINGPAAVAGAGHARANVSASSGSVTASGPITATAARGRFSRSNNGFHNGSLTFSSSGFGSYGEAVTLIHGPTVNVGGAGAFGSGLASVQVTGNSVQAGDVTALGGLGTYHGVDQGRGYAYISGPLGVTLNTMNVGGASVAFGQVYASSGSVTANGVLSVTAAPAGTIDHGSANLFVNAQNAVTLQQGLAVSADGRATVNINAPAVTVGGVASVTATPGDQGNGLHGSAFLNVNAFNSTAVTTVNDVNVAGAGQATVRINGDTVQAHDISVTSGIGHGTASSSFGAAQLYVGAPHGVTVNNISVSAFSFGLASLYAASGSAMATGKADISGQTASLNIYGQTGAGLAQGGSVAAVFNGNANITTPAAVAMGGNLTVSGRHASANVSGNTGVTLGSLTVAGSSSNGTASIHANSGAVAATGKVDVTGYGAQLTVSALNGVSIAQGGGANGVAQGHVSITTPGPITVGGTLTAAGSNATIRLNGSSGVSVGGISVAGGSFGSASIRASNGAVSASGPLDVSGNTARLNVYGLTGVDLAQGGTIAGGNNGAANLSTPATLTVGGTLAVSGNHAVEQLFGNNGVAFNNLSVTGGSFGSASISAASGAVTATGNADVAGNLAELRVFGQTGVSMVGGTVTGGNSNGQVTITTPGIASLSGTLTVSGLNASAHIDGSSGVAVGNIAVTDSGGGLLFLQANNGAVTAGNLSATGGQGNTVYANGATGVTVNNVGASGSNSADVILGGGGGLAQATGTVTVTGATAALNVSGQNATLANGATVTGTTQGSANISAGTNVTVGVTLTVSGARATESLFGSSGVAFNSLSVVGNSFGSASIHAGNGAVTATGNADVSGNFAKLNVFGQTGVSLVGGTVTGGSSGGQAFITTPATASLSGTLTVGGQNAQAHVTGSSGVAVNNIAVTGAGSGFVALQAGNGAVTAAGTLSATGGQGKSVLASGATGVTVNNVNASGSSSASVTLQGGAGLAKATGTVTATGGIASLYVSGTDANLVNGASVTGTTVATANISAGNNATVGGTLAVAGPNATASVLGSTAVSVNNLTVTGGSSGGAATLTGGAVTVGGAANVTGAVASLTANGTNVSFANGATVTGTTTANATLNGTGNVALGGPFSVGAPNAHASVQGGGNVTVGNFTLAGGSSGSADIMAGGTLLEQGTLGVTATGDAFLDVVGTGGVTLTNGATVAGGNNATAVIDGGPMTLGTVNVTATGTGLSEVNVGGTGVVNATSFNVAGNGNAAVVLAGASGLVNTVNVNAGATATFADTGVHVALAQVNGLDATIGGQGGGSVDMLVVNAGHDITESSGASLFANAAGFTAVHAINLSGGSLSLGNGTAPFGSDNISEALIHIAAPNLIGSIVPNGGFSAPSVTFGGLNLEGTAIFIQGDSVGYNGAIAINPLNPLPAGGFVIRYDTFTKDAKIHIVGTLPSTLVAGDVYFDASDFAYPGTTYLVGGTQSYSLMEIGENGAPSGGNGGDDNFFLLTNGDVAIDTPIPTSGQVLVIHPLLTNADYNIIPTAADWGGGPTTGAPGDSTETDPEKKEGIEHQQQTQTGGGTSSGEGQVDNQSGANLECH